MPKQRHYSTSTRPAPRKLMWTNWPFWAVLCTRLVTLLAGQIRGILAEEKSDMEGPLARLGLGVAGFMGK